MSIEAADFLDAPDGPQKNLLAIAKYFASGRVLKTDATALSARRFE
jgi:hypothetical protein